MDFDEFACDIKLFNKELFSFSRIKNDLLNSNSNFVLKKTIFLPLKYEINEYIENE